jgi:hypothetical protein
VTVAMPVIVMLFMAPVTFIVSPPLAIVVVMWMRPGCARVGWLLVAPGHPTIMVALRYPEAANPSHPNGWGWRRRSFIRYRWRRNPDINRNLG